MVLKAIGQRLKLEDLNGLDVERGKIVVDENYQSSIAGVYAGGDAIKSGEDLTVQAVEDGKQAAHAIDYMFSLNMTNNGGQS
jgi:dihydropyrimidine dehydrogenase (NAD+) subunit PreT